MMNVTPQETVRRTFKSLRESAFGLYARWLGKRLARLMRENLLANTKVYKIIELRLNDRQLIDRFFATEVDETDLIFAGVESKRFNFGHSCFVYFGIFDTYELAALGWIKILGRDSVERTILIGKSWRRRGLRTAWHDRGDRICRDLGLKSITKVNENNKVMLEIYRKKGFALDHKEGHVYIIKE